MKALNEAMNELIFSIQNTTEYLEYQEAKEKIRQWPELKAQIDVFRQRNFNIQQIQDQNRFIEEMDRFEQEFEEFSEDSRVHTFLQKELAFCRMIQEINRKITESLDFE